MKSPVAAIVILMVSTLILKPELLSAQTSTYCSRFGSGFHCNTTAPQPQPKRALERFNDMLEDIRQRQEEREKAELLRKMQLEDRQWQQAQSEQRRLFEQQLLNAQLAMQREREDREAQMRAAYESLNQRVSSAILEHRCEDAKGIALAEGQLELAERAMRLCTPLRAAPQGRSKGAKKHGAPAPAKPRATAPAREVPSAHVPVAAKADTPEEAHARKDIAGLTTMAKAGNATAQYLLGVLYHNGQGVPQDYAAAAGWFRKAADQGNTTAQFDIGVMYHDGRGVPQDFVQAYKFLNLASAGIAEAEFREKAIRYREIVAAKMQPTQLADAKAASLSLKR